MYYFVSLDLLIVFLVDIIELIVILSNSVHSFFMSCILSEGNISQSSIKVSQCNVSSNSSSTIFNLLIKSFLDLAIQAAL